MIQFKRLDIRESSQLSTFPLRTGLSLSTPFLTRFMNSKELIYDSSKTSEPPACSLAWQKILTLSSCVLGDSPIDTKGTVRSIWSVNRSKLVAEHLELQGSEQLCGLRPGRERNLNELLESKRVTLMPLNL